MDENSSKIQLSRYKRATELEDPQAMYEIALEFQQRKFYQEAISWLQKAVSLQHFDSRLALIDIYIYQDNYSLAENLLEPIKSTGKGYYLQGKLNYKKNQLDIAESCFRDALKFNEILAAYYLGVIKQDSGDVDGAMYWYGLAAETGDNQSMLVLTELLLENQLKTKAIDWFNLFITKFKDKYAAFNLAYLRQQEGNSKESKALYEKAHEFGHPDAYHNLAMQYFSEGDIERAESYLLQIIQKPGSSKSKIQLGYVYYTQNKINSALQMWKSAYNENNYDAIPPIALWHKENGDLNESRDWLTLGEKADHQLSIFQLAILEFEERSFSKAEKIFRKLAENGHLDSMLNLASTLVQLDRVEEAIHWLKEAKSRGHPQASTNLKLLYEQLD